MVESKCAHQKVLPKMERKLSGDEFFLIDKNTHVHILQVAFIIFSFLFHWAVHCPFLVFFFLFFFYWVVPLPFFFSGLLPFFFSFFYSFDFQGPGVPLSFFLSFFFFPGNSIASSFFGILFLFFNKFG